MTCSKLHTENPQILGSVVKNVITQMTRICATLLISIWKQDTDFKEIQSLCWWWTCSPALIV